MRHITVENLQLNTELLFSFDKKVKCDKIRISCSDYYTLFINGKIVDFGPERTAKGYSRIKDINVNCIDNFVLKVMHWGVQTFDLDFQDLFLGVDVYYKNGLVLDALDLICKKNDKHLQEACKYSSQRGFVERYDNRITTYETMELRQIEEPKELKSLGIKCDFNKTYPKIIKSGVFTGFDKMMGRLYMKIPEYKGVGNFDIDGEFNNAVKEGFIYKQYKLDGNKTGLLSFCADCENDGEKVFIVFDEFLPNNEWYFGRSDCNDVMEIILKKGENEITSAIPYTMHNIKVITSYKNLNEKITFTLIQNDRIIEPKKHNDEKIDAIIESAKNTFMQNTYDIFTDCPGRERAGYLCDSYFTAIAERYFTGKSDIEHNFLENYILGGNPDIPKEMLPMCYPSHPLLVIYIPNWAMWFVVELKKYFDITKDRALVDMAKEKIYNLLGFFSRYENEYGLLEDLPSWVFVEWSKANDYIKNVSFPTNMLYCEMLKDVAYLYNDENSLKKANKLFDTINKMSFNGEYYCDNAIRNNGKLEICSNNISETCQYYALFFGLNNDKAFYEKMRDNYSLTQPQEKQAIAKSNVFIGNFLRMFILLREKDYEVIKKEISTYFYKMAKETKTIWEMDGPTASCNHGFSSSLAYILDKCY